MKIRAFLVLLIAFFERRRGCLRNEQPQANPLVPGDLGLIGPTASVACSAVTFFTWSDPCHRWFCSRAAIS